ncbi:MAG: hypothetical protein BWK75_04830 [Candidatus Altiarchaeales archaeon A3]|nr:MAG: hypothetical protein BWK75_04830 [Candidatus Altiarchaeales archaeon A3]
MKTNDSQRIEFFDREREKEEILHILRTEPNFINFIHEPINSGKTTLITNLIENLTSVPSEISNRSEMPDNYVVIYIS